MSGEQRADREPDPAPDGETRFNRGPVARARAPLALGDYPHHVRFGTEAPDPTLNRALAAAQRIAGEAWHAWWYDHCCRVVVIGFQSGEHAGRFSAWIAAQRR